MYKKRPHKRPNLSWVSHYYKFLIKFAFSYPSWTGMLYPHSMVQGRHIYRVNPEQDTMYK